MTRWCGAQNVRAVLNWRTASTLRVAQDKKAVPTKARKAPSKNTSNKWMRRNRCR